MRWWSERFAAVDALDLNLIESAVPEATRQRLS